jgi:hypothetical protein
MTDYDKIFDTLHEKGYNLKHLKSTINVSKVELIELLDYHTRKLREEDRKQIEYIKAAYRPKHK